MSTTRYHLFDTPIGVCGLAWGAGGIVGVQLPESDESATRQRLRRHFPEAVETAPSAETAEAIVGIVALLAGEKKDLADVPLDMQRIGTFDRRVYDVARSIPPGSTLTYGEVAERAGLPGAARAVGRALGKNPFPIIVPCHRVVAAAGKIGGFSAEGGRVTKQRLLAIEGARRTDAPTLFDL
jgi:methylated-DNA-[protein]-cysteine S-methyltransferase